jgi:hypothetical protein
MGKTITVTTHFDAPVHEVFEVCTDLRNAADRVNAIKKLEVLTEGPIGLGTRFRETRVMMGKEATEEMEFTSFEPNRSYTVEAESCGCHYTSVWTFRAGAGGGTDVEMSFTGVPQTFMAKVMMVVMGPMMSGMVRKCLTRDFEDLKRATSGTASAAPA